VRSVTDEAHRIKVYELADPGGADLTGFTAGSHVDVEVPGGLVRQYSLCGDPARRDRYEIAVLDVPDGRGGSRAMHADVRVGDTLQVSPPRNTFPLHADAGHHLLLAAGIGITPIVAMVEHLSSTAAISRCSTARARRSRPRS
jgi:vanillate O-demethylase ferredoxin subunit